MMEDDETLNLSSINNFEIAWQSDQAPSIVDYLPDPSSEGYSGTLQELVIIELEFRWKRYSSQSPDVAQAPELIEAYIERFPLLGEAAILQRLVEEEFVIRHRYGDRADPNHFVARFPQHADLIKNLAADHPADAPQRMVSGSPQRRQGPVIDNFSLIKEIGEGGMGSVYLAQQEYPVRRKVAVKVIRNGLDSKEVIARFEAERQALAMMDHQNIARVFDAGATQQGQPFFAMEHVDGIPITDYCQSKQTSIPDRLKLFNDVCAAVQHAHQKGILHRDLKPSNVLIAEEDGHPIAKVIDFGLAKAIDSSELLTDKTLQTHVGQVLGTLKYMSPEQAATHESDVDTRADVYALGVILYELLTGETPLNESAMRDQGILTILELIRDHEPVRPSVKLDAGNFESQCISAERSTTSRALRQLLAGDLDWIVMKAIEKDRDRRYDSASSLADDVRRFLNDEPVTARPPSASYRLQKFARKNRMLFASGTAMLLLLISGVAATSWQAVRATNAEITAWQQEGIAIAKAQEAEQRRKEAEASTQRAERTLNFVIESYNGANPLKGAKKEMLASDVLIQALDSVSAKFPDDHESQASLYDTITSSLLGLGDHESARRAAQLATSANAEAYGLDDERTIRSNLRLATVFIGLESGYMALSHSEATLSILQGELMGDKPIPLADLLRSSPLAVETLIVIAESYFAPPHPEPTITIHKARQALAACQDLLGEHTEITTRAKLILARGYARTGDSQLAANLYREILTHQQQAKGTHPTEIATTMLRLSSGLNSLSKPEEATKFATQAMELMTSAFGAQHPRTCEAECQLAEGLLKRENLGEAEQRFKAVIARLHPSHVVSVRARRGLELTYLAAGNIEEALKVCVNDSLETAWMHIVTGEAEKAAGVYATMHQSEPVQSKQIDLLARVVALHTWSGSDLDKAMKSLDDLSTLHEAIQPFVQLRSHTVALFRARLLVRQKKFDEAERLISQTLKNDNGGVLGGSGLRNVDRAWCHSLKAICDSEMGKGKDPKEIAIQAFKQLHVRAAVMPDYLRWTVSEACQRVIRICEIEGLPVEAEKWRSKLPELESERTELTLSDSWQNRIPLWTAGGLGAVQY